jgi:hypothetical protein
LRKCLPVASTLRNFSSLSVIVIFKTHKGLQ